MPTRPALSLNIKDLKDIKGEPIPEGTHKVVLVTFKDTDGTEKRAYKKPCSPDYYPPLSAKYVVAFSTRVRAALGNRASEDRLVYNDAGEIVATVSIEVPNFVPLHKYWSKKKYDDPEKEKMACPTKQMLIAENMAELLISAYIHKNNDLHPDNLSIKGIIDLDEIYPQLTLPGKGYAPLLLLLSEEDIRNFPIIPNRKHWPTNYIPTNGNILKTYKTNAFVELKGDKECIYQNFTALLKELLAFDKEMLKKRMYLALGDETLSLNMLSPEKRSSLLNFNDAKLFYDDQNKERGFVDHVMLFLEQEHIKFRNMMLNMTEFKDFLKILNENPAKILELKEWFINENKHHIIPYNMNFIDTELHSLWRGCFKPAFVREIKQLDIDIKQCLATSPFNKSCDKEYEMSFQQLNAIITSLIKPDNIIEAKTTMLRNLQIDPKDPNTIALNNGIFLKIKIQATQFFESISQLINQYQEKTEAAMNDNHAFIENMRKAIITHKANRKELENWLNTNKSKSTELALFVLNEHIHKMNSLFEYIDKFTKKIEHTLDTFYMNPPIVHVLPPLTNKNTSHNNEMKMKSSKQSSSPVTDDAKNSTFLALEKPFNMNDFNIIHTETTIISYLTIRLKEWITPDREEFIKKLINEAYKNYIEQNTYSGMLFNFFNHWDERVFNMSLTEILSDPKSKWNPASLKTLIIKKLCLTLLDIEKYDPYAKTIYDWILAKSKNNDAWWSTVALKIATKSDLIKSSRTSSEMAAEKMSAH